jgi:hypothetical protein
VAISFVAYGAEASIASALRKGFLLPDGFGCHITLDLKTIIRSPNDT